MGAPDPSGARVKNAGKNVRWITSAGFPRRVPIPCYIMKLEAGELLLMTPVGETLRRERLKRNLELEEISRELKISTRFLQAIENDQYDKLPGGVFAKSFVRQYARLLGLDEEDIAGQVQQVVGPVEVPQPAETPKPLAFASDPCAQGR